MSVRTVIALGCSTDRDYHFVLPITALLWRDHIGHHPLVFLVGTEDEWRSNKRLAVGLAALDEHQIPRVWLGHLDGYPDHTLAQNCRQHAAAVETIFPNTFVIPADADLWPLRRDFYHQHDVDGVKATLYYANGDHFQGKETTLDRAARGLACQTLPTCHVAMRAADWRVIYNLKSGDVTGSVQTTLDNWFADRKETPGYDANMIRWMSDQQIMTEALCQQSWFPRGAPPQGPGAHVSMVKFVNRAGHPPVDRLDRSHPGNWSTNFDASRWTDAHLHKAPESDEHWPSELVIIATLLPQHAEWAKKYREAYVEASR